jgi:hypothetical protein
MIQNEHKEVRLMNDLSNALAAIRIEYLMAGVILIYIPFHLFEEALGNFPVWMFEHRWVPDRMTYGHWMANNLFFYYPLLLLGLLLYHFTNGALLFLGAGIFVWGIINSFDHIVYTIKDRKLSPGLFTGFLFCIVSILGFVKLWSLNNITLPMLLLSVLAGLIYAFLPILFSMKFHKTFMEIFR